MNVSFNTDRRKWIINDSPPVEAVLLKFPPLKKVKYVSEISIVTPISIRKFTFFAIIQHEKIYSSSLSYIDIHTFLTANMHEFFLKCFSYSNGSK